MESAVQYAIRRITEDIDRGILSDAYNECGNFRTASLGYSLEQQIATIVLDGSVFKDIALISGKEETISLEGLQYNVVNDDYVTVFVPENRRGGRRLMEVYRVNYTNNVRHMNNGLEMSYSWDLEIADRVLAGVSPIDDVSTSNVTVIAPNTIAISDVNRFGYKSAVVSLEISNNMSHIPRKAFEPFGDLCVAKAKQLIYTRISQEIGTGKIIRGKNLDVYQNTIDGYSDAGQTYRDLIKRWRQIEAYFDPARKKKHVQMRLGRP